MSKSKNKTIIGKKSKNVDVKQTNIQGDYNQVIVDDLLRVLYEGGHYGTIQDYIKKQMSDMKGYHPLFPDYSAKYDSSLDRVVSFPETEGAKTNYPKIVKGTWEIDYEMYPDMNPNETPWDYANRTQESVQLKTIKHKEFLGEEEDPYPVVNDTSNLITVIEPKPFPKATEARISSGTVTIPIMIRRVGCKEYGKVVITNDEDNQEISLSIIASDSDFRKQVFSFSKKGNKGLREQLICERFYENVYKTKKIKITIGEKTMEIGVSENDINKDIFNYASYRADYIEKLLFIENHFGITLDKVDSEMSDEEKENESRFVETLYASINNKWVRTTLDSQHIGRCDYNNISINELEKINNKASFGGAMNNVEYSLRGKSFRIETYKMNYDGIQIGNYKEITEKIKQKEERIPIVIKPKKCEKEFVLYEKFEGISLLE